PSLGRKTTCSSRTQNDHLSSTVFGSPGKLPPTDDQPRRLTPALRQVAGETGPDEAASRNTPVAVYTGSKASRRFRISFHGVFRSTVAIRTACPWIVYRRSRVVSTAGYSRIPSVTWSNVPAWRFFR